MKESMEKMTKRKNCTEGKQGSEPGGGWKKNQHVQISSAAAHQSAAIIMTIVWSWLH